MLEGAKFIQDTAKRPDVTVIYTHISPNVFSNVKLVGIIIRKVVPFIIVRFVVPYLWRHIIWSTHIGLSECFCTAEIHIKSVHIKTCHSHGCALALNCKRMTRIWLNTC